MTELRMIPPVDDRSAGAVTLAPRLPALAGRRIGLLDNRKGNANVLLERLGEQLTGQGARVTLRLEKRIFSRPAAEAELARLAAEVDAVLTAIGD